MRLRSISGQQVTRFCPRLLKGVQIMTLLISIS